MTSLPKKKPAKRGKSKTNPLSEAGARLKEHAKNPQVEIAHRNLLHLIADVMMDTGGKSHVRGR